MKPAAQHLVTLALFLVLAVAWTWPLVLDPMDLTTSGFDTWGVVWSMHAADHIDLAAMTQVSGWPEGQELRRSDSVVALLLARLWPGQPHPVLAVSLMCLLGPVLSAFAAERCAAALGAKWPWSLIAGVSFGFLGMASATLSGGQVYALVNPWLPLLGWAWVLATSPSGTWRHGAIAGVAWFLCLLTTVYVGIAATLLVLVGVPRLLRSRRLPASLGAALTALPPGLAYVAVFASGDMRSTPATTHDPVLVLEMGSATLSGLTGWTPTSQEEVAPLGFSVLALSLLAPWVLRSRELRWWLALGLIALALALGPTLRPEGSLRGVVPWLLYPLATDELAQWFRFPVRLLWVTGLALGVVAARALTWLGTERRWLALPLLLAAFGEALFLTGRHQNAQVPAVLPSAYAHTPADRAVLDLFPEETGQPIDYALYHLDLSCAWAAQHKRPIAATCLETNRGRDPRTRIARWVHGELLSGEPELGPLADLGFGAVVVRIDHYLPNDRARVLEGLGAALGPPVAETWDQGEHLLVYEVPVSAADPQEAWAAFQSSG